jgi:hypothetical protein
MFMSFSPKSQGEAPSRPLGAAKKEKKRAMQIQHADLLKPRAGEAQVWAIETF